MPDMEVLAPVQLFYKEPSGGNKSDWSRCIDEIPDYVRLIDKGDLISWSDLVAKHILYSDDLPFQFIGNIAFTDRAVRSLVEACRDDLSKLLLWLGQSSIVYYSHGLPLLIQDVHRILKIVRNTDDDRVLVGALKALSKSKFVRSAGKDLILKMIRSDSLNESGIDSMFSHSSRLATRENDKEKPDREIIKDIASEIIMRPEDYNFQIRTSAANYMLEHRPIKLPPLLQFEKELDMRVQKLTVPPLI